MRFKKLFFNDSIIYFCSDPCIFQSMYFRQYFLNSGIQTTATTKSSIKPN